MKLRALQFVSTLTSSFWFVPALLVLAGVLLALGLIELDERTPAEWISSLPWVFSGGASGARSLLSSIASTIITVAGVTFSITVVALTLAAQQYTPRLLREFTADRGNQVVLGTFLATFAYALLVLRSIRAEGYGGFVPHIAITGAMALALVSVGLLVYFIHHVTASLRPDTILETIAQQGHRLIDRLFPEELGEAAPGEGEGAISLPREAGVCVRARTAGYIQAVDLDHLMEVAEAGDLLIRMDAGVGDFVFHGGPVVTIWPAERSRDCEAALPGCFAIGPTRTLDQDLDFALLQIVDIAVKALSPGINDPTTAKSCLDYLGDLVQHFGQRHIPSKYRAAPDGTIRVLATGPDFQQVTDRAFNDIRRYASGDAGVTLHLLQILKRLDVGVHQPARRLALREHVRRVMEGAEATISHQADLAEIRKLAHAELNAPVAPEERDLCHARPVRSPGTRGGIP